MVEPAVLQFDATVVSVLQVINFTEFEHVVVLLLRRYWAAIASPLFVMLLILKGSGVPMQEKQVTTPFLLRVCVTSPCKMHSLHRQLLEFVTGHALHTDVLVK